MENTVIPCCCECVDMQPRNIPESPANLTDRATLAEDPCGSPEVWGLFPQACLGSLACSRKMNSSLSVSDLSLLLQGQPATELFGMGMQAWESW